jgi:hypothetical protein
MKTVNLVQAETNIIRITSLKIGNVIKILEKEYNDTFKTLYGVVTNLYNTGNQSFVEITQYEKSYRDVSATVKVYSGNQDLLIFPATIEEVESHLETAIKGMEDKYLEKARELEKEKTAISRAKEFVNGETSKKLTEASFESITQEQFKLLNNESEN